MSRESIEECIQRSSFDSQRDCIEANILRDTAKGAAGGALIGVIIGAAAGAAVGGAHGALLGGGIGALTGGVAGGAITYYVDNQQASALQDLVASDYKQTALANVISRKNEQLQQENNQLRTSLNRTQEQLNEAIKKNVEEIKSLKKVINDLLLGRRQYEEAVRLKYHQIDQEIRQELIRQEHNMLSIQGSLAEARKRIEQLHEMGGIIRPEDALVVSGMTGSFRYDDNAFTG